MRFLRDILSRGDQEVDPHTAAEFSDLGAEDSDEFDTEYDSAEWDEEPDDELDTDELVVAVAEEADEDAEFEDEVSSETELAEEEPDVPIWELFADEEEDAAAEQPQEQASGDSSLNDLARAAMQTIEGRGAPAPVVDPAPSGGRAKTRLLGFHRGADIETDVFAKSEATPAQAPKEFPVGWLVVIEGPGRGSHFTLFNGVAQIGRGTDQSVCLDFGDSSISRENHAAVAYDEEQNAFFLGHGGKANLVRLNGKPVLSTVEISDGDFVRIGETTMRFVGFCRPEFSWDLVEEDEADCA